MQAAGEGRSYCYFCGRAGRADAPCPSCMVAMPAVFCAGCGAKSSPLADRCGGCGAGQNEATLPEMPCPACSVAGRAAGPLAPFVRDGLALHGCNGCRGVFVPARAWCMLLASPARVPALPAAATSGAVMSLVGCPLCKKPLERGRFAGKSDVVVDLCDRHGIWLDAGELARILAFVVEAARKVAPDVDAAQARLEASARVGDAHLRAARIDLSHPAAAPRRSFGGGLVVALVIGFLVLSALGAGAYRTFVAPHHDDVKGAAEAAGKTLGH